MYKITDLEKINEFETALGHTEQCLNCGNSFLAWSDGCEFCGSHNTISLIKKAPQNKNKNKRTRRLVYDPKTNKLSIEIRENSNSEDQKG